jgi:myo-inositol-1(or 4)-monophosphatase
VQNAGGTVTDFRSGGEFIFGKEIVATNGTVHREFMNSLKRYMAG